MLSGGVSSVDIIKEAAVRKLDFEVSASVLSQLEEEHAGRYLLNRLSLYSLTQSPAGWEPLEKLDKEKKWAQLIEQLNYVLDREPRTISYIVTRGNAYLETGRFENAVRDFQQACRYDPDNAGFVLKLATAHQRGGDARRAIFYATTVIEDRTFDLPTAYLVRGRAIAQVRRYRDAKEDFQVALQRMPLNPESHLELAWMLVACPDGSLREMPAAVQLLRVVESLTKSEPLSTDLQQKLWSAQAAVAAGNGQFDEAIRVLDKIPQTLRSPEHEDQLSHYRDRKSWYLPSNVTSDAFISNVSAFVATRMTRVDGGELKDADGQTQLLKPFLISRYEVTNLEWSAVMGQALVGRPTEPRDFISLQDAKEYTGRLNSIVGQPVFRLPSEAEWEFASRSGSTKRFHFGDDQGTLPNYGWCEINSEGRVHDVGLLKESELGLYDIYGNVAEWCIATNTASASADFGVLRGGSAFNTPRFCDSIAKISAPVRDRRRGVGMRLAAEPVPVLEKLVALDSLSKVGLDGAIAALEQQLGASDNVSKDQSHLAMLYYVRACNRVVEKQTADAISDFTAVLRQGNTSQVASQSWSTLVFLARCQRAWIFATTDLPGLRSLRQAREDAETALTVSEGGHWAPHAILAAVSAAEGAFDKAEQREGQALPLAERSDRPWSGVEFAEASRARMKRYKAREAIFTGELLIPLSAVTQ